MGNIYTQINPCREHNIIGYVSSRVVRPENNYTHFLLEMQATSWGYATFHSAPQRATFASSSLTTTYRKNWVTSRPRHSTASKK
jgi:hypothetical protein